MVQGGWKEVSMTFDEAVETLKQNFEKAKTYDYVNQPLSWALYHTWKESEREEEYERCVVCGRMTNVKRKDRVGKRRFYVEGAGQLCKNCWERIYK